MKILIPDSQTNIFAKNFLDKYCALGFGSLPKKEIDLLILGLLIEHKAINDINDVQGLSRQLRLPLAKTKLLLYELNLRDERNDHEWVNKELIKRLKHSKPLLNEKEKNLCIDIGIDNQLLRAEVEALLKRLGHFPDYSFNREILRLTPMAYATLIKSTISENEKEEFLSIIKKLNPSSSIKSNDSLLEFAAKEFIIYTAKTFGKRVSDMSYEAFKAGIEYLQKTNLY